MQRQNRKFVAGFAAGVILIPACGLIYLRLGYAPVATAAPPLPLEEAITQMALRARVNREAPGKSPIPLSESALIEGAMSYREYCSECHGLPNQPATTASATMFPPPPQLFHGSGVTKDPPGQTYWKIKNGIRLTGMPAFGETLLDDDLWKMSLLLAHADQLPPSARSALANSGK